MPGPTVAAPAARRLLQAALAAAIALIGLGGLTTSRGAGMGCGESWPLCEGRWLPEFSDPLATIEWSHRALAALVGLLTLAVGLALWREARLRPLVAWVWVLLAAQVLLGAMATGSALEVKGIIVLHLGMSMAFVGVLTSSLAALDPPVPAAKPARLARMAAGAALLQILLGAWLVHGDKSPHILWAHIAVGVVVAGLAMAAMAAARRAGAPPGGRLPALGAGWLATVQVGFGFVVREALAGPAYPGLLVAHLVLAAVVWSLCLLAAGRMGGKERLVAEAS